MAPQKYLKRLLSHNSRAETERRSWRRWVFVLYSMTRMPKMTSTVNVSILTLKKKEEKEKESGGKTYQQPAK
jgi:hypothetical protein